MTDPITLTNRNWMVLLRQFANDIDAHYEALAQTVRERNEWHERCEKGQHETERKLIEAHRMRNVEQVELIHQRAKLAARCHQLHRELMRARGKKQVDDPRVAEILAVDDDIATTQDALDRLRAHVEQVTK